MKELPNLGRQAAQVEPIEKINTENNKEEAADNVSSSKSLSDENFEISQTDEAPTKKKKCAKRKILFSVLAVISAVLIFLLGGLTCWLALDPEFRALWAVKQKIDEEYFEEITDEEFYNAIFATVNNQLLDAYSTYMTADEYASNHADLEGNRSGLGIVFSSADEEGKPRLLVVRVCGNSPAERAGILAGDNVLGFGLTKETVQENVIFADFSSFLSQRADKETFYVSVLRGEEKLFIPLCKEEYVENYVFYRTKTASYHFVGEEALTPQYGKNLLACLDDETAYIRLTRFGGNAAKAFDLAMERFKADGKKNLVLDLRENGGGSLDTMLEISKYFCKNAKEKNPVAVIADYGDRKEYFEAEGNSYYEYFSGDSKITVLADRNSASASECLIGCMVDYGAVTYQDICLAETNGVVKTYGKGIMQTTYFLFTNGKDAVRLTTAKVCWPNGNCIHGRGVLPEDGAIAVPENGFGDGWIADALQKQGR